jgi:hypothetical protein
MYRSSYGSKNQIHGEILMQDTSTNPKFRGGLLPSPDGERCGGVGEGGETARGDSSSCSPSYLPLAAACSLSVSLFSISAFVHRENEYLKVYIEGFGSKQIQ